jgi:hypothetical protein
VADFNVIPYHVLQALYVHLHVTRGPIERCPVAREIPREEIVGREILRLLNNGNRIAGTSRKVILGALLRDFSVDEIDNALEKLKEGLEIYSGGNDTWCPLG